MSQSQARIIPVYSSRGEVDAYLVFPYLFNKSGEWIGWVTSQKEVYSVLGSYVGFLTSDPRIVRKRADNADRPRMKVPPAPTRLVTPAHTPLAPLMSELTHSVVDVLAEEPERLHTVDTGELRNDLD
jgi:4-fold beta-flower domain-containing protein